MREKRFVSADTQFLLCPIWVFILFCFNFVFVFDFFESVFQDVFCSTVMSSSVFEKPLSWLSHSLGKTYLITMSTMSNQPSPLLLHIFLFSNTGN